MCAFTQQEGINLECLSGGWLGIMEEKKTCCFEFLNVLEEKMS